MGPRLGTDTPGPGEAFYDEVYDVVETYDVIEEYVIPSGEANGDEVYTTTITIPAVAASTKAVVTTATRVKQ